MIGHHLDRVVGSQEAVFDAVDPGTNTARIAVADGVRGHPYSRAVGFIGDRGELGVGVLLAPGPVLCDMTPPEAGDLDQLGAVANLIPDASDHVGHTVGDALGDRERHDPGREPLETVGSRCPP